MKDLKVTRIEKRFAGYGHNNITVKVTGKLINVYGEVQDVKDHEIKCTSNNTMATDAYFDDMYDEDLENEESFYETRHEAASSLVVTKLNQKNSL